MGQLIEIEFEGLSPDSLFKLYKELLNHLSDNEHLQAGDDCYKVQDVSLDLMKELFARDSNYILTVDADYLKLGNTKINSPRINFSKYDGSKFEMNFNFELEMVDSISENECIKALHSFATRLAQKHSVVNYFCGLDPVVDEDTRFFTNEKVGPFSLPE